MMFMVLHFFKIKDVYLYVYVHVLYVLYCILLRDYVCKFLLLCWTFLSALFGCFMFLKCVNFNKLIWTF